MSALLSVRGLVKRYGGLLVTDHVDIDITLGEIHAVIGPNGAGKTTLVNQIVGEVSCDEGKILLGNHDITHWSMARRARAGIGRSYQINSIIPSFTVLENVLLAVQSYGEQRQIELAMALAMEPKLLLLDEPMAGLGPSETEQMTQILLGLRSRYGILLIEHDMDAVFALAQRVSVLVAGKVVFCGSPQAVRESALVREAYLGDEEVPA